MGKVQEHFSNGWPGAISRSLDDVVISVRNVSDGDIPFGAPVFLANQGAVPFDITDPQEFETFLGFAVRVADKTPDTYPSGQFNTDEAGAWHAGDVMEVLVRGSISIPLAVPGSTGGNVYIRKSDGKLTASAGGSGSTVRLENVRIRRPRNDWTACAEVVVQTRNLI